MTPYRPEYQTSSAPAAAGWYAVQRATNPAEAMGVRVVGPFPDRAAAEAECRRLNGGPVLMTPQDGRSNLET
ncbi:MAG: hypothetical protein K2P78_14510 [Gemmataceae bacterium]|nr:hypothetical protein [Gemmataceae bacterium]